MNILTILGSPRKRGNTAAVLQQFETLAVEQQSLERINITDWTVNGCLGCDVCQRVLEEPGCRQKDDGVAILRRILAADLVIYASPVYAWSISAQLKTLFDRHYCLVKWSAGEKALMEGKRAMLLVTCGGPAEENADLVQEMFRRQMACMKTAIAGQFVVADCTNPAELGERALQTAQAMIERL
jgi:multimeric flavodoxin WrbA